jgi:ribonuclease HI
VWIKGHAENTENEICDRMAVNACSGSELPEDKGYYDEDENNTLM